MNKKYYIAYGSNLSVAQMAHRCPDAKVVGMTMAEKRDLIERITELVKNNILNKEDRDDICRVCLAACSRELAKLKEE